MSKRTIFLETAFWEGFSECPKSLASFAEGTDPVMNVERISKWNSIYKLLLRSDILIDTPLDRLADKASSDSFLRHLLKSNGDGKMALEYQEEPFPNLDRSEEFEYDDDYLALYFTGQEHHKGAQKHGVINVCLDDIWNQQNRFKDSGEAMRADTGWGWNSMDILKENSNSLVIIDNYIISVKANGYWSMRRDLKDLLGLILPYDSSCEYCISLFYLDKSVNDNERENLKKLCSDTISSWIKNNRKNLRFRLELFPTIENWPSHRKDFHDRTIITNNIWIGSEAGFDLLIPDRAMSTSTRVTKSTKTHGLYLGFGEEAANWLDKAYDDLIEDAKRSLRKNHFSTENKLLLDYDS